MAKVDFERLICEAWMSESELGNKLRNCKNEVCFHSELLAEVIHKRVLEEDCLEYGWVLTGFPFSRKDFEYLDCIYTPPNRQNRTIKANKFTDVLTFLELYSSNVNFPFAKTDF
jgi:adenylate kinase family enzyme